MPSRDLTRRGRHASGAAASDLFSGATNAFVSCVCCARHETHCHISVHSRTHARMHARTHSESHSLNLTSQCQAWEALPDLSVPQACHQSGLIWLVKSRNQTAASKHAISGLGFREKALRPQRRMAGTAAWLHGAVHVVGGSDGQEALSSLGSSGLACGSPCAQRCGLTKP